MEGRGPPETVGPGLSLSLWLGGVCPSLPSPELERGSENQLGLKLAQYLHCESAARVATPGCTHDPGIQSESRDLMFPSSGLILTQAQDSWDFVKDPDGSEMHFNKNEVQEKKK